jgi:hypothetical protein
MKLSKEKLIETINNFINDELIVDSNEFIYISVFIDELQNYCNKNNIVFDINSFKPRICFCLGLKLGIKYKSYFKNNLRIYPQFKFKNISHSDNFNKLITVSEYNSLKNEINVLQTNVTHIMSSYLEMVMAYRNTISKLETKVEILETKCLELVKSTEVIEKVKLSNSIINSLNLSTEKDNTYTLFNFCLDFIEYYEDSKSILYSNTIIGDYKKYTNSKINDNTLSKMLKKSLMDIYPNLESKSYNDKNYYKGLIYKNVNIK